MVARLSPEWSTDIRNLGPVWIQATAPLNPGSGTLWWSTGTGQLYIYSGSAWTVAALATLPVASAVALGAVQVDGVSIGVTGGGVISYASGARSAIVTTGGTTTLTTAQAAAAVIVVTGVLTSVATLIVPVTGQWTVLNNTTGAFGLTVRTAAGSGVGVTQGYSDVVLANGTNVVYADNDLSYGAVIAGATINSTPIGGTIPAPVTATALNAASGNVFNDIGRNRLNNGNMEVAQRGVGPFTIAGYTLDQWAFSWGTGTGSITQSNITGFTSRKQMTAVITGLTAGTLTFFYQRIEAARSYDLAGTTVTLSVNISYAVTAGTTAFFFNMQYASAGAPDVWSSTLALAQVTFVPSSTPGTYSAQFAVPSAAIYGLQVAVVAVQAGATGTLTISSTSIQLEPGAVATQFERVDPALNLARCQRFYQLHNQIVVSGYTTAGLQIYMDFPYPVTMRANPTVTFVNPFYSNASAIINNGSYITHLRLSYTITATLASYCNTDLQLSAEL